MSGGLLVPLGLLPALTYALVAYAVRPAGTAVAPLRLALVRTAVLVAGAATVLIEVLSAVRALTAPALVTTWTAAAALALAGAAARHRRDAGTAAHDPGGWRTAARRVTARVVRFWSGMSRAERLIVLALAVQVAGELIIALVSPPNNYDSQTYHLPKIEHWVVQRDVDFYPTSIDRQLAMAPGAEYLLLHLRLLTGGDALYNLLQLAAGLGCTLVASRIAAQFGGSRRAQLLAAFVVGTTPMVALESTSTQTDLVVAAWVASIATLVLDELARRTSAARAAALGAATGLAVLTKATATFAAVPLLLLWLAYQARLGPVRALRAGLLAGVLALAVTGPYLARTDATYHSLLGSPLQRDSISMRRHDPSAVLVNALRIAQTVLQGPSRTLDYKAADTVAGLSRTLHVDPNDPSITFAGTRFPVQTWQPDEDKAAFPAEAGLVLIGAAAALARPRRWAAPAAPAGPAGPAGPARWYAAALWTALLLYVGTVKWQPWGNRLILFLLVLGAPLAGLWLDAVLPRVRAHAPASAGAGGAGPAKIQAAARLAGAGVASLALVASCCVGWLAVGYGWPRRLVGSDSVFTVSEMRARFQRRPQWLPDYEWAAAGVRASGARRVGLVQGYDTWEYPWWLLLRGDDIVSLRSLQAGIPPVPSADVDAILCVSSSHLCGEYVPAGWQVRMRDGIGYAVPPGPGRAR